MPEIFKDGILKDDERETLNRAVEGVRKFGFGEVTFTLCFRNGYVYNVQVFVENRNRGRGKVHKKGAGSENNP